MALFAEFPFCGVGDLWLVCAVGEVIDFWINFLSKEMLKLVVKENTMRKQKKEND
jgi:hypothetical protein